MMVKEMTRYPIITRWYKSTKRFVRKSGDEPWEESRFQMGFLNGEMIWKRTSLATM